MIIAAISHSSHSVKNIYFPKRVAMTAIAIPTIPYQTTLFAFS